MDLMYCSESDSSGELYREERAQTVIRSKCWGIVWFIESVFFGSKFLS